MKLKQILKFPHGFLWGAATAAHQIEGNNTKSDWWAWEHSVRRVNALRAKGKNPDDFFSGEACESYNRFDEDFEIAEMLGHNSTRLSIEWARIEPIEGKFDEKALNHYEKVLQSAKFHGLKTFVTLHHFTNPLWLAKKGGFENPESIKCFERYAKEAVRRLDEFTDFWLTVNEPTIYAGAAYKLGIFPPQKKSFFSTFKAIRNLIKAHNVAADFIRENFKKSVGIPYQFFDIKPRGPLGSLTAWAQRYINNSYALERLIGSCDFIGVNYYYHRCVSLFGETPHTTRLPCSERGLEIYPEGIFNILMNIKKYKKPIYITENGVADSRDTMREKFIKDHLYHIHRAIEKGVEVKGYLYWSLLDNFEWEMGFLPRFGLVGIDYDDMKKRRVRFSAIKYAEICKNNYLEY